MADTTQFFRGPNMDPYLARIRDYGVPEILWPDGRWAEYPDLDDIHEARPISRAEAEQRFPGVDLDAAVSASAA